MKIGHFALGLLALVMLAAAPGFNRTSAGSGPLFVLAKQPTFINAPIPLALK